MTIEELQELGSALAEQTKAFVTKAVNDATAPLLARIAELEARPKGLEYRDVWSDTEKYVPGDAVTFSGSMWVCKSESIGVRPGTGHSCWRLAVKYGRDGRDLR